MNDIEEHFSKQVEGCLNTEGYKVYFSASGTIVVYPRAYVSISSKIYSHNNKVLHVLILIDDDKLNDSVNNILDNVKKFLKKL